MTLDINLLLNLTIFLIMISVGSSVTIKDIYRVFRKPKTIFLGVISQVITFPLIAFLITLSVDIRPEYKIGIIILAACPGGAMSNFISYITKADTALSIGMTSLNSLITLITIPLYISLAYTYFMKETISALPPTTNIITSIILFVIIPVILGALLKNKYPKFIKKISTTLKISTSLLLLIIFTYKIFFETSENSQALTIAIILSLLIPTLILNISGLFLGFFTGKLFKVNRKSSRTLGIEVGLQNTALALLVTGTILHNITMGHPILVYSIFSFTTTLLFSFILKHKTENTQKEITEEIKRIPTALKK